MDEKPNTAPHPVTPLRVITVIGNKYINDCIRRIWGKKVYELVTGDPNALEKVWKAIPLCINDIFNVKKGYKKKDTIQLISFFNKAFS